MIACPRPLLLAALVAWCGPARPTDDDAAEGAALENALRATGLAFETTASGKSWSIRFGHDDDRTQTVYLQRPPNHAGDLLMHTAYTAVWSSSAAPPDDALLRRVVSTTKKLGGFYVLKDSTETWSVRFGVQIDATELAAGGEPSAAFVARLKDLIAFADVVGEETDRELNGATDNH